MRGMLAFGLALVLAVGHSLWQFGTECADIRDNTFRLHVLANSDSAEDQALKLLVRDRILEESEALFASAASAQEAKALALESLPALTAAAEETLREQGCDDVVEVSVTHMYFTTRDYESFSLPAGEYDALRITIGEGKGHNWWCVLYPALCLSCAVPEEELKALSAQEADLISHPEDYRLRFAAVELWESFRERCGF